MRSIKKMSPERARKTFEKLVQEQDIATFEQIFSYIQNGEKVVVGITNDGKEFGYVTNGSINAHGHKALGVVGADCSFTSGEPDLSGVVAVMVYYDGNSLTFRIYRTYDDIQTAIGNIETALDSILAIQNALIGGNS